ncbi:LuxR family transcriptional regulator [Pseudarthrobacter sulfonivorans]|uniref:LuxR C-terminal-related transcriptional regulator n=1 Tax=Pseudarthrobacter sulfonivorans TaxID=121292 RepID=UPI00168B6CCD|nr:LuxR C-terminal-related transcriptional regulator [Pseudarthrobacter sulfonivorans]
MGSHGDLPGNLPAETTSFVGRRRELSEARNRFLNARLVSLVGPGGVGKTRLSLRLGTQLRRNFPDGVWLVELAEVPEPALLAGAVLTALDLREQGAVDPAAALARHVKGRQLLLVFDNCEHLTRPVAQLTSELLKAGPDLRILATSREPLGLVEEHVVPVPPLELPDPYETDLARLGLNEAVQLFVERAGAASGHFGLTPDSRVPVVELCRRLDGIPLAIELAAVKTRAMSLEQIRSRLDQRFALLTQGSPAALPRHQTLEAAIAWSYELLDGDERRVLRQLSVFVGRFQVEDVEAVCLGAGSPAGAADVLFSLVDKSLVIRDRTAGAPCYRLHESMREFAHLRLLESGETEQVYARMAAHYAAKCGQFAAEGRYRLAGWLAWTEIEADNIRAVLDLLVRSGNPAAVDLSVSLVYFWITRATSEGARRFDALLARDEGIAHPWALFVRGFLAVLQNDADVALRALERGIDAARGSDGPLLAQLLAMASIAATMSADSVSARRHLQAAQRIVDRIDDVGAALMVHQAVAMNGFLDGDPAAVLAAAAPGASLSRSIGDEYSLVMMLLNHGFATLQLGRAGEAEQHFREALVLARELDDRVAQCYLLGGLGCCAARAREPRLAAQLFGAAESLQEEAGATLNAGIVRALTPAKATAAAMLGTARFAAETAAGRSLGRGAAVQLALHKKPAAAVGAVAPSGAGVTPTPLGRRELEVARLVAEGCTNKEIGARLFLSERTVESHVRNTLNKLGFSKRAQIAAWVSAGIP